MDIANKLSWEIVALNDRGNYDDREMLAHEIAYGVALKVSDLAQFQAIMTSIIGQVTDKPQEIGEKHMHNQPSQPLKELEQRRKQATINASAKERIKAWLYNWLLADQINQVDYNEAINQLDRIN